MRYLKVMFGNISGADNSLEWEVNISNNWNPDADNLKEMGGFNFSTEDIFVVQALNTLIETAQEISNTPLLDVDGNIIFDEKGNVEYKYEFIAGNIQDLSLPDNERYTAKRGASIVVIICFIVGLVIGYLVALFKHMLDDTFRTKEDLENVTGYPILACIDDIPATGGNK